MGETVRTMEVDLARLAEGILLDYDPRDMPPRLALVERAEPRTAAPLAFCGGRGRSFVWEVGPSSAPADLADRLRRRGLEVESDTRLLVARLPVAGLRPVAALRLVDARTADDGAAYLRFG